MDADVIKTYVELGLGVGIIAAIAYDSARDANLVAIDARHLFATNVTRLAIRRGSYLRDYTYEFVGIFAPPLTRAAIDAALQLERGVVAPAAAPTRETAPERPRAVPA
jgi:LysR family transcriptional regulator, cys regulon transcriptional activator